MYPREAFTDGNNDQPAPDSSLIQTEHGDHAATGESLVVHQSDGPPVFQLVIGQDVVVPAESAAQIAEQEVGYFIAREVSSFARRLADYLGTKRRTFVDYFGTSRNAAVQEIVLSVANRVNTKLTISELLAHIRELVVEDFCELRATAMTSFQKPAATQPAISRGATLTYVATPFEVQPPIANKQRLGGG